MLFNDKDKKRLCLFVNLFYKKCYYVFCVGRKFKLKLDQVRFFFFDFVFIDFMCIDFKNFNIGLNVYDMYVFFK